MKIFIASRRGHYQINRCLNKKLCTCFLPIFTDSLSIRPSYGVRGEEILDHLSSFFASIFPLFPFSPETPDTAKYKKKHIRAREN